MPSNMPPTTPALSRNSSMICSLKSGGSDVDISAPVWAVG